jgi:hypothetical protein
MGGIIFTASPRALADPLLVSVPSERSPISHVAVWQQTAENRQLFAKPALIEE